MKKFVTLICAWVILCMFSATALAAEEITFRNIPWGSSMTEVKKALGLENFYTNDEIKMRKWIDIEQEYNFSDDYPAGWSGHYYNKLKVAGYDASLTVYCAYGLSADNKVLRGILNSVLYAGGYEFSVIDHEAAYLDLKSKLTGLYGEGTEEIEEGQSWYINADGNGEYDYKIRYITWNGDNNTQVKLLCVATDLDDPLLKQDRLVLWYGKSDIDAYLDKLQLFIHQEKLLEEQQNRTDSTDGL